MNNKDIVKQMIDFHKTSFENCFSMMVAIQEQAEKLFKTFLEQSPGISSEGTKVFDQWSSAYKKGIDDLKKSMDEGYSKLESFLDNDAMNSFQDQTEKMFNAFLNQANWMPPDLKKTMGELAETYKKNCDEFKKYVDENIWRMINFSPFADQSRTKTKGK